VSFQLLASQANYPQAGRKDYMDNVQLRTYELTYLLPGSLTDGEVAQVRTEVDGLLKKYKAADVKTEDWGRKPMAYLIRHEGKKQREAVYVHHRFSLSSDAAQNLDRDVRLSAKVMRHLLLVTDDTEEVAAETQTA
jgi:ribosomal protein S6